MNAKLVLGAIAAGAAVVGVMYAKDKLPAAVAGALNAINPANQGNVFYTGVNDMGAVLTGNSSWNLGARLFELTSPAAMARERALLDDSYSPASVYDLQGVVFP